MHTEAHRSGCSFRASNPTGAEATPPYTLYTTRARTHTHTHTHIQPHRSNQILTYLAHLGATRSANRQTAAGQPEGAGYLRVQVRVQGISGGHFWISPPGLQYLFHPFRPSRTTIDKELHTYSIFNPPGQGPPAFNTSTATCPPPYHPLPPSNAMSNTATRATEASGYMYADLLASLAPFPAK